MSTPTGPYGAPGDPWSAGTPATGGIPANSGYPGQQPGYQQPGYPQPGYQQPGYPQAGYQQPGYQQPGYPPPGGGYGMPSYPGGPMGGYRADPGPPPARPATVSGAFWLWMAVMVAGVVGTVVLFTGNYLNDLLAGTPGLDEAATRLALNLARNVALAGSAVAIFIYLFFGSKMLLGRNWARVVLTVLGGLSVLSSLVSNTSTVVDGVRIEVRPELSVVLGWVQAALAAVAIILMFLPASNAYFTAVKARRMYVR